MTDEQTPNRPRGRPFPPRRSGNPKGRPKGARNEADLLYQYLNKTVGRGPNKKTLASIIVMRQYVKAANGDHRASAFIFEFREKFGGIETRSAGTDQPKVKLAKAHSVDEFDLRISPAREAERQYYKAILDRNDPEGRKIPQQVVAGDEEWDAGRYEEALRIYLEQVRLSKDRAKDPSQEDLGDVIATPKVNTVRERALARIGLLARYLILEGEYAIALRCADAALAEDGTLIWVKLIRAHARMFLGATDESRAFYLAFQSEENVLVMNWENVTLLDFAEFRKKGRTAPLMAEVEIALRERGWSTTLRPGSPMELRELVMSKADEEFIRLNPLHLETAAMFVTHGRLDDAWGVYRHILKASREDGSEIEAHTSALAEIQLSRLARALLFSGRFDDALECINELSPAIRNRLSVQATLAHALLLTNRVPEAEEIYRRHRGKLLAGKAWEKVMLDDLQELRAKGSGSPAAWRLENLFEGEADVRPRPKAPVAAIRDDPPLRLATTPKKTELALRERADIQAAEELARNGEVDDALTVYRRFVASVEKRFKDGIPTLQQRADRQAALEGMSDIAFQYILDGKFELAEQVCREALGVDPNASSPAIRHAHALMFLGRPGAAEPIYRRYFDQMAAPGRPWSWVLIEEFKRLRAEGRTHPLMEQLEMQLNQRNRSGIGKLQR